jgi:formylglycine-generating enzyme required for sulfatase activity
MSKKFKISALFFMIILFLLNACQSPILSGINAKPTNTPLVTKTLSAPTQIPATPTPTEISTTPTQTNIKISDVDQMEMIYIKAGEFIMGTEDIEAQRIYSGNGVAYPEVPQSTFTLPGYWMDKFEVTTSQYAKCVAAGACKPAGEINNPVIGGLEYYTSEKYSNYPIINVSWFHARAYCSWAGRRLPSEAEWEKAARGTDGRKYPWGNEKVNGELANFCDKGCTAAHPNPSFNDGYPETAPVGSFPKGASPYGIMDMAGNVWEWTSTIPKPYPYVANDGREAQQDVAYGTKWPQRVLRGGTWSNGVWWQRSSVRYRIVGVYINNNIGFRCAASE